MKPKLILCLALVLSGNCYAAIVYPKAPDGGRQVVRKNLDLKFLGVARIEDVTISYPHREYSVADLTNLISGRLLSATELGGWRYLLIHGTNAVGTAGLETDAKTGKVLGFSFLEQSGFAYGTLEALRIAEKLPLVKNQDYELRFLNIAPAHFVAVWLHGQSDDIIIPLPNTFGRWNAYQPYSESEMIELLKPEAKKKLKAPPGIPD